jgi:N-methylhydantoinase B
VSNRSQLIDPITLEVMKNALEATAQEMGAVLKLTSFSPNIKERMDASCAVFDARAQLVAPTIAAIGRLDAGDIIVVNDPFPGGGHLPDITVIGPIYAKGELIGYVATRAHHSDVGGMEPGSMPAKSREIFQEGLIIPPVRLYSSRT